MTDREQKTEKADERVARVDEPDVEAHKLEQRADLGETEEPDVEAHRFARTEQKHE